MPAETRADRVRRRNRRTLLAVAAIAAAFVAVTTIPQVVYEEGDVTALLRVGRYAPARAFVEQDFPDPVLTQDLGHDGQQFYVLAGSVTDLNAAGPFLDHLPYRARRILFPLTVAPLPAGAPTVWGMWGVNLLAVGAAAAAIGVLARRLGLTPWLGLSAAITPALIESTMGSLADGMAFALALWGIVVWRRHLWWAIALFTLAAFTRETTLVAPFACLVLAHGWDRAKLLVPFAALAPWVAWTTTLTDPHALESGSSLNPNIIVAPFTGWALGTDHLPQIAFAAIVSLLSVLAAWRLRHRLPEVSIWLCADVLVLIVSVGGVIDRILNASRVVPLAIPAMALVLALERRRPRSDEAPAGNMTGHAATVEP